MRVEGQAGSSEVTREFVYQVGERNRFVPGFEFFEVELKFKRLKLRDAGLLASQPSTINSQLCQRLRDEKSVGCVAGFWGLV